jgi:ketosteroid isomerase-like protein
MPSSARSATAGPREIFERFRRMIVSNDLDAFGKLAADDVIVEEPFAPPGRPRRIVGREQIAAYARPRRAALPVRFEDFRDVVIHDTADPQTIIAEYAMTGTVTTTGRQASASFVTVLTVRDGQIVRWREYQDTLGIALALGQLSDLIASLDRRPTGGA